MTVGLRNLPGSPDRLCLLLYCRVTWRHREPYDVRERPCPPVRDMADQPGDLVGQHGLRTDNSLEKSQPPCVLTRLNPLENEPVDQLARKPHPNPTPNNTIVVLISRHQIVKRPIQMRQRIINSNPSHRKLLGGTPSLGRRPCPCPLPIRHHPTISSRPNRRRRSDRLDQDQRALSTLERADRALALRSRAEPADRSERSEATA